MMDYTHIDVCDVCGEDLEDGRWLSGLCEACEAAAKAAKRVLDA